MRLLFTKIDKRAQVTLFFIIAIAIIIIALTFILIKKPFSNIPSYKEKSALETRAYLLNSIKNISEKALIILSLQGGYIENKKPYFEYKINNDSYNFSYNISYWIYNKSESWPSIADIERQMIQFIQKNLPNCSELEKFYVINCGSPRTNVTILKEKIRISVNYPVLIENKGKISPNSDYIIDLNITFFDYYNTLLYIAKNYDCITCLDKKANEQNISINQIEFNDTIINMVIDKNNKLLSDEGYFFNFAIEKK